MGPWIFKNGGVWTMRLKTMQLENILKSKINSRKIIDDSKPDRAIEKIECSNKNILIKYGSDIDLQREMNIYEKVLNNSEDIPVPKLLVSKKINKTYFLAMEWIDGIHPDFKNTVHIEKVFTSLGKWAANWSPKVEGYDYITKETLSNFDMLNSLLKNNKYTLNQTLDHSLIDLLNECIQNRDNIIGYIKKLPLTLDPGDISLHNFILNSTGEIILIDFESCKVSPMVTLVEHLGEDYESIPHKEDDVFLALNSYLNGWNKFSTIGIKWDDFIHCQFCSRVHYDIGKFNYWIRRILENKNVEETLGWIKQGHKQLQLLLKYNT